MIGVISISLVAKCKIKSCNAPCAVGIMLPILSHDSSVVTSLNFHDVSKFSLTMLGAFDILKRNILAFEYLFFGKKEYFTLPM